MQPNWNYGNAWEQFPIEEGEVWGIPANNSRVAVHNLFNPLPSFMHQADMLFVDPPWNQGNINSFYTKAGRTDYIQDFSLFEDVLFQRIGEIHPQICYLEVGFQAVDKWQQVLSTMYPVVQRWNVVYYRKHPCYILRGGTTVCTLDYHGMNDEDVTKSACHNESCTTIGDLCMGRGLVGVASYKAGKPFVGTEINKRRLANLLQKLKKLGVVVGRFNA